jgi:hypothetical protein
VAGGSHQRHRDAATTRRRSARISGGGRGGDRTAAAFLVYGIKFKVYEAPVLGAAWTIATAIFFSPPLRRSSRTSPPWPPVLALTTFDGELLSGALRAGAPGFVLKERGAPTPRSPTLRISNVTVKSHIGRIFVKLDLRDRAAVIVYAYENGIVAPR